MPESVSAASNSAETPALDALNSAEGGLGVLGRSSSGHGVRGESDTSKGVVGVSKGFQGVFGHSDKNAGVVGESAEWVGVYGTSLHATAGIGVMGQATQGPGVSGNGTGVVGASTGGPGVKGTSVGSKGVVGTSRDFHGVYGHSDKNAGVVGESAAWVGVFGKSRSPDGGIGVMGDAAAGDGANGSGTGVRGSSTSGTGVQAYSETGEALHAETGSAGMAAIAAVNVNSASTGSALFARGANGNAGYFEGSVQVTGDLTVAGDVILAGADLAEQFEVREDDAGVGPGCVVTLDDDGRLMPTHRAYDPRVAGIVSGAGDRRPGLVLDRLPEGTPSSGGPRVPVAVVGKAWCRADATTEPIAVGDLLTTSVRPGHAMRAVDRDAAFGAVIGKALSPLAGGTGPVLVLVGLG